eukprot:171567-Chlamydomonas_euryale.AAC.1
MERDALGLGQNEPKVGVAPRARPPLLLRQLCRHQLRAADVLRGRDGGKEAGQTAGKGAGGMRTRGWTNCGKRGGGGMRTRGWTYCGKRGEGDEDKGLGILREKGAEGEGKELDVGCALGRM